MGDGAADVGHVASLASGFVPAAVLAEEASARFVLAGEGDGPRSRLRRSREPNGSAASGGRPKWPAGPRRQTNHHEGPRPVSLPPIGGDSENLDRRHTGHRVISG